MIIAFCFLKDLLYSFFERKDKKTEYSKHLNHKNSHIVRKII